MQAVKNVVKDIRNRDRRLVARWNPNTATLEIQAKGCLTSIRFLPDGEIRVDNTRIRK